MEILNILASIATILSLIISILVYNKVSKIDNSIKTKEKKNSPQVKGNRNVTSGRDSNINK
jgi:hypothetical protein